MSFWKNYKAPLINMLTNIDVSAIKTVQGQFIR